MNKTFPKIGDQLYLSQRTGNSWVDMVKRPYTVIAVSKNIILVQEARCIFPLFKYDPSTMSDYYKQFDGTRPQFYDTLAEEILPDPSGYVQELTWHAKKGMWGTKGRDSDYPEYAFFGHYDFQPYLN